MLCVRNFFLLIKDHCLHEAKTQEEDLIILVVNVGSQHSLMIN